MFENNIIDLAIEFLKKEFPNKSNSWIKRAFIRFILNSIKQIRNNLWIVKGIPELGDKFEHYEVVYIPEQNRYYCSCFEHLWGFKRRKEICTHIAAVILWKKYNHLNEIVYAYFLRLKCCNSIIQVLDHKDKVRIRKIVKKLPEICNDTFRSNILDILYIIYSKERLKISLRIICDENVNDLEIVLKPVKRYVIEILSKY